MNLALREPSSLHGILKLVWFNPFEKEKPIDSFTAPSTSLMFGTCLLNFPTEWTS